MKEGLKYGIICAALFIAFKLIVFYGGYQTTRLGILSHFIALSFFIPFALLAMLKKKRTESNMSYGLAAKTGMKVALVIAMITFVFHFAFYTIESDKFKEYAIEFNSKQVKNKEDKKENVSASPIKISFAMATGFLFSSIISGALISFSCAAFFARKD